MDQIKIGKFIRQLRKEKKLTQKDIAEKLNISDKTVSKWETGNGLPEVSLMLPLCNLLGISVNELLSGEKLDEKQYQQKAEENFIKILDNKKQALRQLVSMIISTVTTIIAGCTIIAISGLLPLENWQRILLIVIGLIVIIGGLIPAIMHDREIGTFQCKHCGEEFVPTFRNYLWGAHTIKHRKLTCPKCGKRSWCKKHYLPKD